MLGALVVTEGADASVSILTGAQAPRQEIELAFRQDTSK
jgi:hypothetical protein